MELYKTIYFFLLLSLFFEFSNFKDKKAIMVIWCLFFAIFSGIRWGVGGDWDQYYGHFLNCEFDNMFNYDRYGNGRESLEPGFIFINALIKSVFREFWVYNLIITAFIEYAYFKFSFEFSPNHPLIPFILINMGVLFPVRAGLSIGVVFLAYRYIIDQKIIPFILIVGIATLIHNQCIVLLPIYWIGKVKLSDFRYYCIFIFGAVSTYLLQDVFISLMILSGGDIAEKALLYTEFETEGAKGSSYMGWVLNFFFLWIYLYIKKRDYDIDEKYWNLLLNGFIIYMMIFFTFQEGMGDLARLSGIYFPIQLILLSLSYEYFVDKRGGYFALLAKLFIFAYFFYKWTGIGSGYFFEDAMIPYTTIFD